MNSFNRHTPTTQDYTSTHILNFLTPSINRKLTGTDFDHMGQNHQRFSLDQAMAPYNRYKTSNERGFQEILSVK